MNSALEYANQLRLESARIRADLNELHPWDSLAEAARLLREPPVAIQHTRLERLLGSVRQLGPSGIRRILRCAKLPASIFIGPEVGRNQGEPMSAAERERVARLLERWGNRGRNGK